MARKRRRSANAGRPTKLTAELSEALCDAIRAGATIDEACESVGLDVRTFHRWQGDGNKPDAARNIVIFVRGVSAAKEARIHGLEEVVVSAAQSGDWRAAMRMLEAYNPKRFAPRVAVHIEQELSDALQKLKLALTADEYERAVAAIAGETGGAGAGEAPEGEAGGSPVTP